MISLVSGSAGGASPPPDIRLFKPVALAVHFQNMDIVCEAIEQRIGETLALENARQFLEWKIRLRLSNQADAGDSLLRFGLALALRLGDRNRCQALSRRQWACRQ
jgi:hypothetical protein